MNPPRAVDRRPSLLSVLERAGRRRVSWDAIGRQCALTASEVEEEIRRIADAGFAVGRDDRSGIRLAAHDGRLSARTIEYELGTARVGRNVLVFRETTSTNDVAWQTARQSDCDGTAIFAERQTAGRGRMGSRWSGGDGQSLLLSVILVGAEEDGFYRRLNLAAAVAVVDAIRTATALAPRIKWPNDVVVEGKKVCGAMVETRVVDGRTVGVLGLGVNCLQGPRDFPAELRGRAISLRMAGVEPVDRLLLARGLLRRLDEWLAVVERQEDRTLTRAWRLHADATPERLSLARDGRVWEGRVVSIDPLEGLLLQVTDGKHVRFDARSTHILR